MPGDKELVEWAGVDNVAGRVPRSRAGAHVVRADHRARRAPRTRASSLPSDPIARADVMGTLEMIAGEDGLGWNGRLAMIHAGLTSNGERGFAPQVAALSRQALRLHAARPRTSFSARVTAQLGDLASELAGSRILRRREAERGRRLHRDVPHAARPAHRRGLPERGADAASRGSPPRPRSSVRSCRRSSSRCARRCSSTTCAWPIAI